MPDFVLLDSVQAAGYSVHVFSQVPIRGSRLVMVATGPTGGATVFPQHVKETKRTATATNGIASFTAGSFTNG